MSETFQRILASFLCVQLSLLGMTLEGCAARPVTTTPDPSQFANGAQPKEPTLRCDRYCRKANGEADGKETLKYY